MNLEFVNMNKPHEKIWVQTECLQVNFTSLQSIIKYLAEIKPNTAYTMRRVKISEFKIVVQAFYMCF